MIVTRRQLIASGSAALAACALGSPPSLAGQDAVFPVGSTFDRTTFDRMLVWASSRKASSIVITANRPGLANIDDRIVKITDRSLSSSEIEKVVRDVYGENGVAEILAGFNLDPMHKIHIPGAGVKRYRVNMTAGHSLNGVGIQISAKELAPVSRT